mgnify:CR=1 FL=1
MITFPIYFCRLKFKIEGGQDLHIFLSTELFLVNIKCTALRSEVFLVDTCALRVHYLPEKIDPLFANNFMYLTF